MFNGLHSQNIGKWRSDNFYAMAISAIWAEFKTHSNAVKLHLGFSLNDMLTSCFLVTAASYDERKALVQLMEIGRYLHRRSWLPFF